MTIGEVQARVEAIRATAYDAETAHALEDDLHQDVLRFIAMTNGLDSDLAAEALKTTEIEFARHCA